MTQIFDVTPPLRSGFPVWPGDTAFSLEPTSSIAAGEAVDLSRLETTLHLGCHADATRHTESDGVGIDQMPLHHYLGRAVVLDVRRSVSDGLVPKAVLDGVDISGTPRVLLRTGCSFEDERGRLRFPSSFAALHPELAAELADRGALLLGTDAPSVDPLDSKDLESHHHLLGRGVAILEGLLLEGVPTGVPLELIALPLRLVGADASPVRAILRLVPDADPR